MGFFAPGGHNLLYTVFQKGEFTPGKIFGQRDLLHIERTGEVPETGR